MNYGFSKEHLPPEKLYSIKDIASAYNIGRNKLYEVLRKESLLEDETTPTDASLVKEYFRLHYKLLPNYRHARVPLCTERGLQVVERILVRRGYHKHSPNIRYSTSDKFI